MSTEVIVYAATEDHSEPSRRGHPLPSEPASHGAHARGREWRARWSRDRRV